MSERTRGQVIGAVFSVSNETATPADIADWISRDTLPYFKGDFEQVVAAIDAARNGPIYQGKGPHVWERIHSIGDRDGNIGRALATLAINKGIDMPGEAAPAPGVA